MRELAKFIIAPIVALLLGTVVTAWWINSHPETEVLYSVETTSIPARAEMKFDAFTRVTVRNPSCRVRATNVHLTVGLPAADAPEIGEIESPEDPATVNAVVGPPGSSPRMITLHADRLAPGSHILVPIWWRSTGSRQVLARGTADQCVLAPQDRADTSGLGGFPATLAALTTSALLLALMFVFSRLSRAESMAKTLAHLPGAVTLAEIKRHWDKVISKLREDSRTAEAAFVREATPVALDEDDLTLRFGHPFHYNQMTRKRREAVAQAVRDVFGITVRIGCRYDDGNEEELQSPNDGMDDSADSPGPWDDA